MARADEVIPSGATWPSLPGWFIIVRRDKPVLYQHLRESYAGDSRVTVIVDRRATSTAVPPEANERQGGGSQRTRWTRSCDRGSAPSAAASATRVPGDMGKAVRYETLAAAEADIRRLTLRSQGSSIKVTVVTAK